MMLAAMTVAVHAQGSVKFGVKGGLNITQMSFDQDVVKTDNQTGFFIGPTVQASLPGGLGMDISALYDQRESEVTLVGGSQSEAKLKHKTLNFPVNLRYKLGFGSNFGIYGAAGPQFGFPLGDKVLETEFGEYRLRDANLSLNLGAGLYVTSHFEIGFTYNIAMGKSGEFDFAEQVNSMFDKDESKANAWQVTATILF